MNYKADQRIVLTLDAGGTNFAFSGVQRGEQITESVVLPAEAQDLDKSLDNIITGFERTIATLPAAPVAISFAFPGPADYPQGIIANTGNLPAYAGGVALGPMLEDHFSIPVFMNNDGDLFAYGEAVAGLLPKVNQLLEQAGSAKRYENLFAVTLGTGLGGGIVSQGQLFLGDNSAAGEIWLLRNKVRPEAFAEEGASIRAVRQSYAERAGLAIDTAPQPHEIFEIALGQSAGDQQAARHAFDTLAEVVGDVLANVLTLIDGIAVIGGGLAGASALFLPRVLEELNGKISKYDGEEIPRLAQQAYNLEDETHLQAFLHSEVKTIQVPKSQRTVVFDPIKRLGVGISVLGTNRAVGIGAYCYALQQLDKER